MTDENARARAEAAVAERFTRFMDAAVSPYGVLTDLSLASAFAAIPLVFMANQAATDTLATASTVVLVLIGLFPIAVAFGVSLFLRQGRTQVVQWLAQQPFPIENLNTMLVGLGDGFEVVFEGSELPTREELQPKLDRVSEDTMLLGEVPEDNCLELRVGVYDSKSLPARSHYLRYARFRRIVEEVLVPLHTTHPIRHVRIS
jgi:hypothetical protein